MGNEYDIVSAVKLFEYCLSHNCNIIVYADTSSIRLVVARKVNANAMVPFIFKLLLYISEMRWYMLLSC